MIRWHRLGSRLVWRYKSRPGRPPIASELRRLIRALALNNVYWGEERIANELLVKLGIRVLPRTVRKYMPKRPGGGPRGNRPWRTFLPNHASTIVACDVCVVVTATFRLLYVLVVIEHGSRRLLHCNVTEHPTAEWTRQPLREAIPLDYPYRCLMHDRDSIFSGELDAARMSRLSDSAHRSSSQKNSQRLGCLLQPVEAPFSVGSRCPGPAY